MFILLHFAVVISAFKQSLLRKICPESVESSWIVGAEPVIWSVNEGELVTETDEITDSTRTDVFVQLTVNKLSASFPEVGLAKRTYRHSIDLPLDKYCRVFAAEKVHDLADFCLLQG